MEQEQLKQLDDIIKQLQDLRTQIGGEEAGEMKEEKMEGEVPAKLKRLLQ